MSTKGKSNGKHANGRGSRLSDLFGITTPLVAPWLTRIKAEWRVLREQMKIPRVTDIEALKRRVHHLEKKISGSI